MYVDLRLIHHEHLCLCPGSSARFARSADRLAFRANALVRLAYCCESPCCIGNLLGEAAWLAGLPKASWQAKPACARKYPQTIQEIIRKLQKIPGPPGKPASQAGLLYLPWPPCLPPRNVREKMKMLTSMSIAAKFFLVCHRFFYAHMLIVVAF